MSAFCRCVGVRHFQQLALGAYVRYDGLVLARCLLYALQLARLVLLAIASISVCSHVADTM